MKTETNTTTATLSTTDLIITRYRPFAVRYSPATNTRGSRVVIRDLRRKKSRTIPYNHEFNNCSDIALNYLASIGIVVTGMAVCDLDSDCLLLSEDFQTDLR